MWTAFIAVLGAAFARAAGWADKLFTAAQPQRADFESVTKQWEGLVTRLTGRIDSQAKELEEQGKEHAEYRRRVAERFKAVEADHEQCRQDHVATLKRMYELEAQVAKLEAMIEAMHRVEAIRSDPAFQARQRGQNEILLKAPESEGPK